MIDGGVVAIGIVEWVLVAGFGIVERLAHFWNFWSTTELALASHEGGRLGLVRGVR